MDSAEKRLNELGYKQELRRQMVLFQITFLLLQDFLSHFCDLCFWKS